MAEEKKIVKREVKRVKKKKSKKKRLCRFLFFIAIIAGIVLFLMYFPSCSIYDTMTKGFSTRYEMSSQYKASSTFEQDSYLDRLSINWAYGSVEVKTHDLDKVSIVETTNKTVSEKFMMHYNYQETDKYGKSLLIQYCKAGKYNFGNLKKDLVVYIPKKDNIYLSVTTYEADIKLDVDCYIDTLYIIPNHSSVDAKINDANKVELTGSNQKKVKDGYHFNFISTGKIDSLRQTSSNDCNLVLNEVSDLDAGSVYKDLVVFANKINKAKLDNSRANIKLTILDFKKINLETNSGGNINIYLKEECNATITATIKEHYDTNYMGSLNTELGTKTGDTITIGSGTNPITVKAVGDVNIYKYEE